MTSGKFLEALGSGIGTGLLFFQCDISRTKNICNVICITFHGWLHIWSRDCEYSNLIKKMIRNENKFNFCNCKKWKYTYPFWFKREKKSIENWLFSTPFLWSTEWHECSVNKVQLKYVAKYRDATLLGSDSPRKNIFHHLKGIQDKNSVA